MAALFEAVSINGMSLRNRFVRSATCEGLADKDGNVTSRLTDMMAELARNEVGLIISGFAFVSADGQSISGQMAVHDDHFLPGLHKMSQAVHAAGGKIAMQLVHAGRFSNPELTKQIPMGPSAEEDGGQLICTVMSKEDIAVVIRAFAKAANRAKQAGFDAIQLHAAHGFLLSQFLSPAFNIRIDEYGGPLENRARLLLEAVKGVRAAVGSEYPILVKLNSEDFLENGMTRNEAVKVAKMLEEASVDSIEFSAGTIASHDHPDLVKAKESEVYYREAAQRYKQQAGIPLMLVGGIRSLEVAEKLVLDGVADFVSLSRPLIAEPDLISRWHAGDRRKAACISCNGCIASILEGKGFYCVVMGNKPPI